MSNNTINKNWQDIYENIDGKELVLQFLTYQIDKGLISQEDADSIIAKCIWISDKQRMVRGNVDFNTQTVTVNTIK